MESWFDLRPPVLRNVQTWAREVDYAHAAPSADEYHRTPLLHSCESPPQMPSAEASCASMTLEVLAWQSEAAKHANEPKGPNGMR
mmetsp:Transcript_12941/g.29206  ORF Transcript_12941/g.29206 Transcript_12941/m.29206 type:complete len:85 (+) Transcript_12941:750-1004(+)|eukprot:2524377-Amphidinium_carterae.2